MGFLAQIAAYFTSSFFTNIINAIYQFYSKSQDTKLSGFQTAAGTDLAAYQAYLNYDAQMTQMRLTASTWWGARILFMLVGISVCLHVSLIFLDSTFKLGCNHYGCLGVVPVPAPYDQVESMVMTFLFGGVIAGQFMSTVNTWLGRKQ